MDIATVFFGTPEFAAVILQSLIPRLRFQAVVTRPDRPKGRGRMLLPPPVKLVATASAIPVFQPLKASDPLFVRSLSNLKPDLIITAAYGQILPKSILDIPRLGCVNVHASLLPKYRGAAPINWAIIRGETETGITLMRMEEGLDTGAILEQRVIPIDREDHTESLTRKLSDLAVAMFPEFLPRLAQGEIQPVPQDSSQATLAPILHKEDGIIRWTDPAERIRNRVRGLYPWPAAQTWIGDLQIRITGCEITQGQAEPGIVHVANKERFIVGTGENLLAITELQPAGKSRMPVQAFLQGRRVEVGLRLNEGPPPT